MLRKMPDDGDVKNHLNDLFDAVDKLQSMNVEINGDMPSSYCTVFQKATTHLGAQWNHETIYRTLKP